MSGKKITELQSGSINDLTLSGTTAIVYSGVTFQHQLSHLREVLVDSGSHVFNGDQIISGTLDVTNHTNLKTLVIGNGTLHTGEGGNDPETLRVGNKNSFNIAHFEGNHPSYAQINIKNINSGSGASSDIVATADNGDEDVHYVNLGINSSTYNSGYVGYENDSYLLNAGKDLYVGTIGGDDHPSKLCLFSNNEWENPQITIHSNQTVSFNTENVTEGFQFEFTGDIKNNNNVETDGFVILSKVGMDLDFVDDTAAANGNVPLYGLYRNGNDIKIRLT